LALSSAALADPALKKAQAPMPAKMTCQDFLALDDVAKPKLVYWVEGVNSKGNPNGATFDVVTTDSLVPVLIQDCQAAPTESFWKKAKVEFKKVF
jgi:hypothetical protein